MFALQAYRHPVKGSFSFHETDGSTWTIPYTVHDHNNFNVVVRNTAPTAAASIYYEH